MIRIEIVAAFELKKSKRYENAFDFARIHFMDYPFLEFSDDEISSEDDDVVLVSAERRKYVYKDFISDSPVYLKIAYRFEKNQGVCEFVIEGEDAYMAQSLVMEQFQHMFTSQKYLKSVGITYNGCEVSD